MIIFSIINEKSDTDAEALDQYISGRASNL